MPRFSKQERTVLIEVVSAFAESSPDRNVRSFLNSALRKLKASDEHHAKKEAEGRKA